MRRRVGAVVGAGVMAFAVLVQAQGDLTIPAPRGLLSDFAGVVGAERARQITALAQFVRDRSGGEIAIVTLPDIGGRDAGDVALRIGREWGVGAAAAVGDARRNAGVVVLVVPKETSRDGQGYVSIQTGQGAEGFITDGMAGDIRREATERFRQQDYGGGLLVITYRVAERYAAEFGFSLDSAGLDTSPRGARSAREPQGIPVAAALVFFAVLVMMLLGGGRRTGGMLPFLLGQVLGHAAGRGRRGGYGGFGGGFGGGGGGFGGFGGGGGFSGGGSSGNW